MAYTRKIRISAMKIRISVGASHRSIIIKMFASGTLVNYSGLNRPTSVNIIRRDYWGCFIM